MNALELTKELRETGELGDIENALRESGGDRLVYQPSTNPNLMQTLGYQGNHYSPYATTYGYGNTFGNFTPISYDYDADELVKVLSRAELDKYARDVMSGKREDDLGLRLNGSFNSYQDALEDAVRTNYLKKVYEATPQKMRNRADRAAERNPFTDADYFAPIQTPATGEYNAIPVPEKQNVNKKPTGREINELKNAKPTRM